MSRYITFHTLTPYLPDGRLARPVTVVAPEGRTSRITYEHLQGHIHPDLLRDLDELSRHIARTRSVFFFDGSLLGTEPLWDGWVERVPADLMPPLVTFTVRRGSVGGREFLELRCRATMISAALADELNSWVFPGVNGALIPLVSRFPGESVDM